MPGMVRVATRGSALARWQAGRVAELLRRRDPDLGVELVVVDTTGDRRQDVPVWEIGGQGVFVKEVQAAVLDGRAEMAVHSAKDLPSVPTPGLVLAAFPERGDPRDALVGAALADLGPGATVATGSVRRRAQLSALCPGVEFVSLRGNIATRLGRVPRGGAAVVAAAALDRLGLTGRAAEVLDATSMVPQVGQGALAVECRDGDGPTAGLLAAIDDAAVRRSVTAERAFLATLGSGCDLPVGAWAREDRGQLVLNGVVEGPAGLARGTAAGAASDPARLGRGLAEELLAQAGGLRS